VAQRVSSLGRSALEPHTRLSAEPSSDSRCDSRAARHPQVDTTPTAHGFTFVTLEDESGHVQIIVPPKVYSHVKATLRSRSLVVSGRVQRVANWRGLVLESVRIFAPAEHHHEHHWAASL
jgi:DNA polymerase III alpha subunit